MFPYDDALSDSEIDLLELQIPRLAAEATTAAYHRALSTGLAVLVVRGTDLIEVSINTPDKIVGSVPLRTKVAVGKTFVVRRTGGARLLSNDDLPDA